MLKNKDKNTFYCFSPPVMIATFAVEIILAIIVFLKYKSSTTKNIIIALLVLLGIFQFVEFFVCGSYFGQWSSIASRVGYVAITFLPPLSIHLANEIGARKKHWTTYASYILAVGFTLFFIFVPNAINDSICTGNYVIFNMVGINIFAYGLYYFGLLLAILIISASLAAKQKNKKIRNALHWLIVGTLAFILPTAIIYFLAPQTGSAIPSVMCGFAIIYAIILAVKIAPVSIRVK